jgi:hypothetical protein
LFEIPPTLTPTILETLRSVVSVVFSLLSSSPLSIPGVTRYIQRRWMEHWNDLLLSDNDVGRKVVAFSYGVADRKFTALVIAHTVRLQLALPLGHTVTVFAVVVFRGNDDPSLIGAQVRDNVAPSLVVVNTQSDDEIFAGVGLETKGATCPAVLHFEHMGSVNFAPDTGGSVFPIRLLDEVEERA